MVSVPNQAEGVAQTVVQGEVIPPPRRVVKGGIKRANAQATRRVVALGFILLFIVTPFLLCCLALPQFTGVVGAAVSQSLHAWVGMAAWVLPMLTLVAAMWCLEVKAEKRMNARWVLPLLLVDSLFLAARCSSQGGSWGQWIDDLIVNVIGSAGAWMVAVLGLVVVLFVIWQLTIEEMFEGLKALGQFTESNLYTFCRALAKIGGALGRALVSGGSRLVSGVKDGGRKLAENRRQAAQQRAMLEALEAEAKAYEESGAEEAVVEEPPAQPLTFKDFFEEEEEERIERPVAAAPAVEPPPAAPAEPQRQALPTARLHSPSAPEPPQSDHPLTPGERAKAALAYTLRLAHRPAGARRRSSASADYVEVGVEAQAPAPPAEAASEPVSEGLGLRPVRHSASGEMAPNLKSEAVVVPNIPVTSGERSLAASPAKESPQPLEKAESKASLERATSSLGDRGARLELEKESQPAPKVEVADPRLEAAPAVASAPAAAPAAPSLGELSLQELKKLSPSERRKALGLTRRSGSKAAVVSQDAPSAPAPDPEATVAVESIPASASFSSLKASKLNGLSLEERRQLLGLDRSRRQQRPAPESDSQAALHALRRQEGPEGVACDSQAAWRALGLKAGPPTFTRPQRGDLMRSATSRAVSTGRVPEAAANALAAREAQESDPRAAVRANAIKLRASFKRQAEHRARMRQLPNSSAQEVVTSRGTAVRQFVPQAAELQALGPDLRPPAASDAAVQEAKEKARQRLGIIPRRKKDSGAAPAPEADPEAAAAAREEARQAARQKLGIIPRRKKEAPATPSAAPVAPAVDAATAAAREAARRKLGIIPRRRPENSSTSNAPAAKVEAGESVGSNSPEGEPGRRLNPQQKAAIGSPEMLNALRQPAPAIESLSRALLEGGQVEERLSQFHAAVGSLQGVAWSAGSDLHSLLNPQLSALAPSAEALVAAEEVALELAQQSERELPSDLDLTPALAEPLEIVPPSEERRAPAPSLEVTESLVEAAESETEEEGERPLPAVSAKLRSSAERSAYQSAADSLSTSLERAPITRELEEVISEPETLPTPAPEPHYPSLSDLEVEEEEEETLEEALSLGEGEGVDVEAILPRSGERWRNLRPVNMSGSSVYQFKLPAPQPKAHLVPRLGSERGLPLAQPARVKQPAPESTSPLTSAPKREPEAPPAPAKPLLPAPLPPLEVTNREESLEEAPLSSNEPRSEWTAADAPALPRPQREPERRSPAFGLENGVRRVLGREYGAPQRVESALPERSLHLPRPVEAGREGTREPLKVSAAQAAAAMTPAEQYLLPSLDLLNDAPPQEAHKVFEDKSDLLLRTLASFRVEATLKGVIQGPTVTRYELEPAIGVRVSKFTSLTNDIALALAATSIRIEAPVPGKSVVGIEVPNNATELVVLKEVLNSDSYRRGKGLCVGLGKDITGFERVTDLCKMPHLLVAGTTGSGKSVCINTLILSLIYRFTPRRLQLLMIDPKQVELSIYEGLPHLITLSGEEPGKIIVDPKLASAALRQMVELMEERFNMFAKAKVRNLGEYNHLHPQAALPWVVVIIDELADLMMVASKDVEHYICRLAQKARAAGIHMVVATQRPSTDVITGLLKVNIPSRIAFAVSSGVDSRVILDTQGAEHLLGKGDMLFKPVDANESARIQGAFVTNEEIQRVVDFWNTQAAPENRIELQIQEEQPEDANAKSGEGGGDDPLLPEALEAILQRRQASASMLQTDLRVGYARARRLLNLLEQKGYVGPAQGSKAREILFTADDLI